MNFEDEILLGGGGGGVVTPQIRIKKKDKIKLVSEGRPRREKESVRRELF